MSMSSKAMSMKNPYGPKLFYRLGPNIGEPKFEAKRVFPEKSKLSYEKHIVGFKYSSGNNHRGMDIIMSDGTRSNYKEHGDGDWHEASIPYGSVIHKVVMFARENDNNTFTAVKMFDKDGKVLMDVGH